MMKKKSVASIATLLFFATSAVFACRVHFTVQNESGHVISNTYLSGPYFRQSPKHTLKAGDNFSYTFSGSMFSCHGKYNLKANDRSMYHHDITGNDIGDNDDLESEYFAPRSKAHHYKHDANVRIVITSTCQASQNISSPSRCDTLWS